MSDPIITSELVRAARALLRWDQKALADRAGVSHVTVRRLEAQPGPLVAEKPTIGKLKAACEAAGVEFLNHGRPGVRLSEEAGALVLDHPEAERQKAKAPARRARIVLTDDEAREIQAMEPDEAAAAIKARAQKRG